MIEIKRKSQQQPQQPATGAEMPTGAFDGAGAINTTQSEQNAQKRQFKPFTGLDSSRNYRAMYRAACEYHERHNPPRLDDDNGETYWREATDDISAVANSFDNDPFITGLLVSIFEELEREYTTLKDRGKDELRKVDASIYPA